MDSMSAHRETLRDKHLLIDEQIQAEYRSRNPDFIKIVSWKKEKLHIKEQLEQ